jgi:23S rRNA (uridine2552-2'-O)-methyltransferase
MVRRNHSAAQMKGKGSKKPDRGPSGRSEGLRVKVKTTKTRTASSNRWLERQLNDPYVYAAKAKGYRSRAAFKLLELDAKFHFLKKGGRVLDLGAAPGGWSQVAQARVGETGRVVGADILPMEPITGVELFQADLTDAEVPAMLRAALGGPADLVLTDMAAPTTGHRATDHLRTVALFEIALEVAADTLKPGGAFVGKVFQGGATGELLSRIKKLFRDVKHVKPPASRAESVELYLVAQGFRG